MAAGKTPWSLPRLREALDAERLRYEPGKGWVYSNIGYLKVRQIIEQVSGLSLGGALAGLVFEPLGLTTARLATAPEHLADVEMADAKGYHPGWVYHGLVVGTAAEAARLLHALLSGALLRPETLEKMLEGRALPEHRSELYPDPAYGLGLMIAAADPRQKPIGHTGGGPGSGIAVYSQLGRTGAVWAASSSPIDPVAKVFSRLANGCS